MSKSLLLMLCLITGLLVLACTHADTNRNAAPSTASSPVPAGPTNKNANTNTAGTVEKVGIPECDSFLNAYETCVGKVPEAGRAQFQSSLATLRTQWKKLADNPQTRGTLAAACKTQRETTMAAMKAYNCTW